MCQSGSCRRRGSEAVLLEIEELVSSVGSGVEVDSTRCLGLCRRAPAAVIVRNVSGSGPSQRLKHSRATSDEQYFSRIDSLEKSSELVSIATGKEPRTDSDDMRSRLSGIRSMRVRQKATSLYRWNEALTATWDQYQDASAPTSSGKLRDTLLDLYRKAGFREIPDRTEGAKPPKMPEEIDKYSRWDLENVSIVSKHSAVFSFASTSRKRGTPHPRGGGRKPPPPNTWHVTMLAEVGWNDEGPLPWIERDYTPISTAKEWEEGRCDMLIKVYNDGAATSWLHHVVKKALAKSSLRQPPSIWFSQPLQTLRMPKLVTSDGAKDAPYPSSVLLLLAGTGVVALPQIIHHRDPINKLNIPTHSKYQLHVPLDLVLSCREDDVLLLPEILQFCEQSLEQGDVVGVRNCTLLLTSAGATASGAPFEGDVTAQNDETQALLHALASLPNVKIRHKRLSPRTVAKALSRMPEPCRIVVSGPGGFNTAAREMLADEDVDDEHVTILEA